MVGSEKLNDVNKMMRGSQGNVGLIPKEIGDKLQEKVYNNFDDFRKSYWKEVANSSYANEFSSSNVKRMNKGLAPKAVSGQHYGKISSYILHHKNPIHNGGGVYDLNNLVVVTPKMHQDILDPNFHFNN